MVAEAVQEPVVEETQGITPETPESILEQPAAEPETDYSAVLAELIPDATDDATSDTAVADSPEAALKDKTPEQLLELGEQRALAKLSQQNETTQARNRETGLRNVLATSKSEVQAELSQAGVDTDTALRILAKFDQVHGTHIALKDTDINAATQATVAAMKAALTEAGAKFTGLKDFEPGTSLDEYATKIAEHARKGYKSAAEVKDERKAAQIDLLKRLKAAGVEIPTERVPNLPEARAVSGSVPTMAQYTGATFDQRIAWQKADPDIETKIIEREATRRS